MFSNSGAGGAGTPRRSARASRRPGTSRAGSVAASPTIAPSIASTAAFSRQSPAPSRRQASVLTVSDALVGASSSGEERAGAEKVLVRDTHYIVKERQRLPVEIERLLANSDSYTDPTVASLDPTTGFAFALSKDACLLWNYTSATPSTTVYAFPCPGLSSLPASFRTFVPLPFAAIVPATVSPATREPGLVLSSPTGEIRYWDHLSLALTSVDRFAQARLRLNDKEVVKAIKLVSSTSVLLSTSQSRIFIVFLSKAQLVVRPLERPASWGIWNAVFGSSKAVDPRSGIIALALSQSRDDRIAYAVSQRGIQVWRVPSSPSASEGLLVEHDLFAAVLEALHGEKVGNEQWALNERKVEILDAIEARDGTLAVLVSYQAPGRSAGSNALSYAVVRLDIGTTPDSISPAQVSYLDFTAPADPRPFSTPRLVNPDRDLAFVVFPEAVVMLSFSSSFEETFTLKAGANRFIGCSSTTSAPSRSLSLVSSTPSIINVALTSTIPLTTPAQDSRTGRLQNKIEQAIYYGSRDAQNPLAFEIREQEGDLVSACENVSRDILASASPLQPPILDLRVQLADRVARAKALIELVGANGLLGKLSPSSRRHLSADAEKLSAAAQLWQYQNASVSGDSLLTSAIHEHVKESGEIMANDFVRTFFRTGVSSLGSVLEHVGRLTRGLSDEASNDDKRLSLVREGNRITLLVLDAVEKHREQTSRLYALEAAIATEPWTSRPPVLEMLTWLFKATDALIRDRQGEASQNAASRKRAMLAGNDGQRDAQDELKAQLCALAGHIFTLYEERIRYLRTLDGDGVTAELKVVPERYSSLRPAVVQSLVQIGRVGEAYALAEKHRHFEYRTLVELASHPTYGSQERVRSYLDKYRDGFAFALYQYLVEKGQVRALLDQSDNYQDLLDQFLAATDNPRIAWMNDVHTRRYDEATRCLVSEALKEHRLAQKKLMLSVGKLCQIAQVSHETLHTEGAQRAIEAVDDNIDLVNSQQGLKETLLARLPSADTRASSSRQAESVASRFATTLDGRPALRGLFVRLTGDLFDDKALAPESLIDLLTLKDNQDEHLGDYGSAIECFVRARHMPKLRKEAVLQDIWRRVYLHDDWSALREASESTLNDEQIGETLRSTALYATLVAMRSAQIAPFADSDSHSHSGEEAPSSSSYVLEPARSVYRGTAQELATVRFGDVPSNVVEGLRRDYDVEADKMDEFIRDARLDEFVREVQRLVEQDGEDADEATGMAVE